MAIYDIAGAIQQPNIVGAYQQGVTFRNALADLAAKRAEEQRQTEIRNGLMQFYKQAQPEQSTVQGPDLMAMAQQGANMGPMAGLGVMRDAGKYMPRADYVGPQSTVMPQKQVTAPAQPASMDYQGAADYLASKGEFEQSGALAKLRSYMTPDGVEYGLNPQTGINPDTGAPEFFVTNKQGKPKFLGITEKHKLDVKGGWVVGPNGEFKAPVPMTPQERQAQARADEQLKLSRSEAEAKRAREAADSAAKTQKQEQERLSKFNSVNDLDSTLAAYKQELQGTSRIDLANPTSEKAIRLGSLATQLQMAYKNAAELGAISGPDWAIINRIIATPSGAKAALIGSDGLLQQISQVEALSKRNRERLNSIYGGKPAAGGFSVTAPNGKTYSFPSQQAADDFRAKAGIR